MHTVEVFADVLCPFTHVGLRTLVEQRTRRGRTEPRLRIRAWPLELVNGNPLDPHHIAAEIVALRASVRPDLFAGFSVETFPTTSMAAFALTAAADRTGDPAVVEEVGLALRNAVFEEGLDIGRLDVIEPIATASAWTCSTGRTPPPRSTPTGPRDAPAVWSAHHTSSPKTAGTGSAPPAWPSVAMTSEISSSPGSRVRTHFWNASSAEPERLSAGGRHDSVADQMTVPAVPSSRITGCPVFCQAVIPPARL